MLETGASTDTYGFAFSPAAITGAISAAGSLLATGLTIGSALNLQQQQQAHETQMVKEDQKIADLGVKTADAQTVVNNADTTLAQESNNQTLYTMGGVVLAAGALAVLGVVLIKAFKNRSEDTEHTDEEDDEGDQ